MVKNLKYGLSLGQAHLLFSGGVLTETPVGPCWTCRQSELYYITCGHIWRDRYQDTVTWYISPVPCSPLSVLETVLNPVLSSACIHPCPSLNMYSPLEVLEHVFTPVNPRACIHPCPFWSLYSPLFILAPVFTPVRIRAWIHPVSPRACIHPCQS
jgi:hypothetical protein